MNALISMRPYCGVLRAVHCQHLMLAGPATLQRSAGSFSIPPGDALVSAAGLTALVSPGCVICFCTPALTALLQLSLLTALQLLPQPFH